MKAIQQQERPMSQTAPQETRNFSQFIQALEDGATHAELTEKLKELATAMDDHVLAYGGTAKSKLTLTIDFKADKGVVEIVCGIATKMPKAARMRSIFWTTKDHAFSPSNPKQPNLFGPREVVDPDTGEIRSV